MQRASHVRCYRSPTQHYPVYWWNTTSLSLMMTSKNASFTVLSNLEANIYQIARPCMCYDEGKHVAETLMYGFSKPEPCGASFQHLWWDPHHPSLLASLAHPVYPGPRSTSLPWTCFASTHHSLFKSDQCQLGAALLIANETQGAKRIVFDSADGLALSSCRWMKRKIHL